MGDSRQPPRRLGEWRGRSDLRPGGAAGRGARARRTAAKQGWNPKRTIIYCAWDGEEPGLLGSTEWAEAHDAELKQHAAVYINTDGNGRGYLGRKARTRWSTSSTASRATSRTRKNISAGSALFPRVSRARRRGSKGDPQPSRLPIGALGSGSDYTAFLDHLGVASINMGYGGEDGGGIYHSIYDDFYWYTHFGDTDFVYGRALSQTAGTAIMRLADADLLPFEFTDFADTIHLYLKEIKKDADNAREEAIERDKNLDEGSMP